jgi:hypothetical protein
MNGGDNRMPRYIQGWSYSDAVYHISRQVVESCGPNILSNKCEFWNPWGGMKNEWITFYKSIYYLY